MPMTVSKYPNLRYYSVQIASSLPPLQREHGVLADIIDQHGTVEKIYDFELEKSIVAREEKTRPRQAKSLIPAVNEHVAVKIVSTLKSKLEQTTASLVTANNSLFEKKKESSKNSHNNSTPTIQSSLEESSAVTMKANKIKIPTYSIASNNKDENTVMTTEATDVDKNPPNIEKAHPHSMASNNNLKMSRLTIDSSSGKEKREQYTHSAKRRPLNSTAMGDTVQKFADALLSSFVTCTGKS
jgi:hypothetical protein